MTESKSRKIRHAIAWFIRATFCIVMAAVCIFMLIVIVAEFIRNPRVMLVTIVSVVLSAVVALGGALLLNWLER